jgi:uncharacterized protein with FMN-binding domain
MYPKRGAFAALVTIVALIALLSYKTPELQVPADPAAIMDDPNAAPIALGPDASPTSETLGAEGYWPSPDASPTDGGTSPTGTAAAPTPPPTAGQTPAPDKTATRPARTHAPTARPPAATPAPKVGFTGSVTGSVVTMRYGPVQVRATFSKGKITDVVALKTPTADSKSVSIAAHAVPILRSEALVAQSASIHTVSGATYTSKAYISSLQYAISHAR